MWLCGCSGVVREFRLRRDLVGDNRNFGPFFTLCYVVVLRMCDRYMEIVLSLRHRCGNALFGDVRIALAARKTSSSGIGKKRLICSTVHVHANQELVMTTNFASTLSKTQTELDTVAEQ